MKDFIRLAAAVERLYRAAHWTPDRKCDAEKLWEDVRDAAGIAPGQSPKPRTSEAVDLAGHCVCGRQDCPNDKGDLCDAGAQRK